MRKFRQSFASVVMVAIFSTAILGVAKGYSDELAGAYNYAFEKGITTQPSIDDADMNGKLTRGAMAKMMVNYAEKVLGKKSNASMNCNFNDIARQSQEFQAYIQEVCKLGLMGVNNDGTPADSFDPNGIVTRAQLGTVLSRVLYGEMFNGGNPYYRDHLNTLKYNGIMNDIDTPNVPEARGYVMLMMQRADESRDSTNDTTTNDVTSLDECSSYPNDLFCELGLDSCPAVCKTTSNISTNTVITGTKIQNQTSQTQTTTQIQTTTQTPTPTPVSNTFTISTNINNPFPQQRADLTISSTNGNTLPSSVLFQFYSQTPDSYGSISWNKITPGGYATIGSGYYLWWSSYSLSGYHNNIATLSNFIAFADGKKDMKVRVMDASNSSNYQDIIFNVQAKPDPFKNMVVKNVDYDPNLLQDDSWKIKQTKIYGPEDGVQPFEVKDGSFVYGKYGSSGYEYDKYDFPTNTSIPIDYTPISQQNYNIPSGYGKIWNRTNNEIIYAWASNIVSSQPAIYLKNLDTGKITQILGQGYDVGCLARSNNYVVYERISPATPNLNRYGDSKLILLNLDNNQETVITGGDGNLCDIDNGKIVSASSNSDSLYYYNISESQLYKIPSRHSTVPSLEIIGNKIYYDDQSKANYVVIDLQSKTKLTIPKSIIPTVTFTRPKDYYADNKIIFSTDHGNMANYQGSEIWYLDIPNKWFQ